MSTPSSSSNHTSEAKLKAEARRRRILEQSRTRIGVVSGEQPSSPLDKNPNESPVTGTEASTDIAADVPQSVNAESHNFPTTPSGMNRYAQMRRKRFTSKKEDEEGYDGGTNEENKEKGITVNVTSRKDERLEDSDKVENQENISSETVGEKEKSSHGVGEGEDIVASKSEEKHDDTDSLMKSKEKKYVGVAKMRRKLLAEQKAAASTEVDTTVTDGKGKSVHVSRRTWAQNMPLFVHVITVWILLLSGFSIGIKNHPWLQSHGGTVVIHRNVALVENGIGILSLLKSSSQNSSLKPIVIEETLLLNSETFSSAQAETNVVDKEFEEKTPIKPAGVDVSSIITKQSKIDPLFRVDLDELTEGKSGLLFTAARVAISIHRFLLVIFWMYPYMIIRGILTKPLAILNPPLPIFFIYAVLIRFSTKYFLGIGPEPNLSELWDKAYKGGDSKESSSSPSSSSGGIILEGADRSKSSNFVVPDILSMGKNFFFNMIQTKFPKLTVAYGIYKDARSDMFVVLCGFFLGVAFPLQIWGTTLFQSTRGNDEL